MNLPLATATSVKALTGTNNSAKASFTETTHGIGFDGTYNPQIEVVNMIYTI